MVATPSTWSWTARGTSSRSGRSGCPRHPPRRSRWPRAGRAPTSARAPGAARGEPVIPRGPEESPGPRASCLKCHPSRTLSVMLDPVILVVYALAVTRLTGLITLDTITEDLRDRLIGWLDDRPRTLGAFVAKLIT